MTLLSFPGHCPSQPRLPPGRTLGSGRDRISRPREQDSSLGPYAPSNQGFAQHQSHLPSASACCNHSLQSLVLTRLWQDFIRKGFEWQLFMLQDTLGFSSNLDLLGDCCYLFSGSEDCGLNTKYTPGFIKMKKGLMSCYLPSPFVKSSTCVQLIRDV